VTGLNIHPEDLVLTKTVRPELHRTNTHGRAAISKLLITENNAQMRKRWCHDHETWTLDNWKRVIWSDEPFFTLFTFGAHPRKPTIQNAWFQQ
jgi:hypothetical protein